MNKSKLAEIRFMLVQACQYSTNLKALLTEIADSGKRCYAEQLWLKVDTRIRKAKDDIRAWRIGFPKGQHRIKENQLDAIRQWYAAPHPKPKVRALAKTLELSPTTVYAVLKELGWKKPKKG